MHKHNNLQNAYYNSPLGWVKITCNDQGVTAICFIATAPATALQTPSTHPILKESIAQLNSYFNNKLHNFSLPLSIKGTPFQKKVWDALLNIPYGQTTSYGQLAQLINNNKHASQAVGAACGQNKIWLVVPCHRVLSSTGKLTGYAGGIERKDWLLKFEKSTAPGAQMQLFF